MIEFKLYLSVEPDSDGTRIVLDYLDAHLLTLNRTGHKLNIIGIAKTDLSTPAKREKYRAIGVTSLPIAIIQDGTNRAAIGPESIIRAFKVSARAQQAPAGSADTAGAAGPPSAQSGPSTPEEDYAAGKITLEDYQLVKGELGEEEGKQENISAKADEFEKTRFRGRNTESKTPFRMLMGDGDPPKTGTGPGMSTLPIITATRPSPPVSITDMPQMTAPQRQTQAPARPRTTTEMITADMAVGGYDVGDDTIETLLASRGRKK
jgi:hypothetical protein